MAMEKIKKEIKKLDSNSNYNTDLLKNHPLAAKLRQGQTTAAQILNLDAGSVDGSKIKGAYKKLALILHPDKNGDSKYASVLFQAITEASNFLFAEAKNSIGNFKNFHPGTT